MELVFAAAIVLTGNAFEILSEKSDSNIVARRPLTLCPFGFGREQSGGMSLLAPEHAIALDPPPAASAEYIAAVKKLDIAAVQKDLVELFSKSNQDWPADYGNYAPFFVRLAWHCSGTYRLTDGAGGCSGGRQRFDNPG
jgi:hypothetical protein